MADFFPPAPPTTNDSVPVPPPVATPNPNLPPEQAPTPDNFTPIAPPTAQNQNQKKLLIIIGAVVGVIILIAIIAWLLYQNLVWNKDEKILTDAWHKMFTYETATFDGKLEGEGTKQSDEDESGNSLAFSGEFSGTISKEGQSLKTSFNTASTDSANTDSVAFQGEARHFANGDIFFFVNNYENNFSSTSTLTRNPCDSLNDDKSFSDNMERLQCDDELDSDIDFSEPFENKWILYNPSEYINLGPWGTVPITAPKETQSDELQNCYQQKIEQLRTNKSMQVDLARVLSNSQLFTISRQKETQKHEDETVYLFDISIEPKNHLVLYKSLLQTQIYAQMRQCAPEIFAPMEEAINDDQRNMMAEYITAMLSPFLPNTTLWISQDTHELVRAEFDLNFGIGFGSTIKFTASANLHFNQPVALTKPTEFSEYQEAAEESELIKNMNNEVYFYAQDQENLALAYKTARVIENYDLQFGRFPWDGDPHAPYYANLAHIPQVSDGGWLRSTINDAYGLTYQEAMQLETKSVRVFKPQGQIDTIYVYTCFSPESVSFQEEAAKRCIGSTASFEDFDPCETKDGTVQAEGSGFEQVVSQSPKDTSESTHLETVTHQGNLICVSNDGTTFDVPLKPEAQELTPKKYQYYLDNIAGADLSTNGNAN